jgi:site-specific recombinase
MPTFALTWTAWLAPAALGASGHSGFFRLGGPVFLLGIFAPALVAWVTVAVSWAVAALLLARMRGGEIGAMLGSGTR